MAINKVKYGETTLIDLTGTTATSNTILQGYGAYGKDGVWIDGIAKQNTGMESVTQDQEGFVILDDDEGNQIAVNPLSVTENGTYRAATGNAYNPVTVNVPSPDFIVTLTKNSNDEWEPDCTFAEAKSAYDAGKNIVFTIGEITIGGDPANSLFETYGEYNEDNGYFDVYIAEEDNSNPSVKYTIDKKIYIFAGNDSESRFFVDINNTFWNLQFDSSAASPSDVLSGKTFVNGDGRQTGTIATKSSSDLTVSGATVTAPAGYYSSAASKSVATMTLPTSASTTGSGTNKATIGRSTSTQYINIPTGYNSSARRYTISATPNGSVTTPATTITANPTISVNSSGLITATTSASQNITPTVSAGYVSSGTAGTVSVSGSKTQQLTTKGATTYTPSTTTQTIASGTYLTGTQTISGDSNLVAENIKKDVTIFGITGTAEPDLVAKTVTPTKETQIVLPEEEELVGNHVPSTSNIQLYSQGGEELVTDTNKGYYIVDTTNVYYISTSDLPLNFRVTVNFQESRQSSSGTTVFATKTVEGEGTITSTTGFDVPVNDNYVQKFIVRPVSPYSGSPYIRIELYVLFSDISYSTSAFTHIHVVRTNLYLSQEHDGLSQVTVNPIPDNYIIPSGTTTITENGTFDVTQYASATVNVESKGEYYEVYKALANNALSDTTEGVSEWCNSFSTINTRQFEGRDFSGTFTFTNANTVGAGAFGRAFLYNVGTIGSFSLYVPNASTIGSSAFCKNFGITHISGQNVTQIYPYAFSDCRTLKTVDFPNCVSIGSSAFDTEFILPSVNFPSCTNIGTGAFNMCSKLSIASFPVCTSIGSSAFWHCSQLSSVNIPNCVSIGSYAFLSCSALTSINLSNCTTVGNGAFTNCYKLSIASFPICTSIGSGLFSNCSSLATVNFPNCTSIGSNAFYSCSQLESISFPNCTYVGGNAFQGCYKLSSVNIPNCTSINTSAFTQCSMLTSINLSSCTIVSSSAFRSCWSLTTVILPACTNIGNTAFSTCYNLLSLYLLGSSYCSLQGTNAFYSTPISNYTTSTGGVYGSIFVPASLYNSYVSLYPWNVYSSRFVSLTEAEVSAILNS